MSDQERRPMVGLPWGDYQYRVQFMSATGELFEQLYKTKRKVRLPEAGHHLIIEVGGWSVVVDAIEREPTLFLRPGILIGHLQQSRS